MLLAPVGRVHGPRFDRQGVTTMTRATLELPLEVRLGRNWIVTSCEAGTEALRVRAKLSSDSRSSSSSSSQVVRSTIQ